MCLEFPSLVDTDAAFQRDPVMPKTRPPYAPEFCRQMVEWSERAVTQSLTDLARQFEPSSPAIRNWVARADREEGRREARPPASEVALPPAEREELTRLRRENKQLRLERDILSRTTAYFARETGVIPVFEFMSANQVSFPIAMMAPREHDVAVPPALALLDADDHPAAVDVGDLDPGRLGGAQSSRIRSGQRGASLQARDRFQKAHDLVSSEHHRQFARRAGIRDPLRLSRCTKFQNSHVYRFQRFRSRNLRQSCSQSATGCCITARKGRRSAVQRCCKVDGGECL